MKLIRLTSLCLLATPLASLAHADSFVGPELGLFFPTDSTLRSALGNSWFSFGVGRLNMDEYSAKSLKPSWNAISQTKNGSKVFMFAYTYGYVYPLGDAKSGSVPYYSIRGGLSYVDYAVQQSPANRISGKTLGYNLNAEVGILLGEKLTVSARYDVFGSHDGLKFDGLSLSVKYGLFKF